MFKPAYEYQQKMKKQLNNKDLKEINDQLKKNYQLEDFFDRKEQLFEESDKDQVYLRWNNEIVFFFQQQWIPSLKLLLKQNILKTIAVDHGAIPFIINGADIMRPGITVIEPAIKKNEVVVVVDNIHKKPLAVGIALFSTEEIHSITKGKVVKNVHYIGDSIWNKV